MKKFYFLLLGLFLFSGVNAQVINFPDANFKNLLLNSAVVAVNSSQFILVDVNNDNEIQLSEALQVEKLFLNNQNISNLSGIEFFTNLKEIECQNNQLTSLNVVVLANLRKLVCFNNQLTSLNVDGLTNLKYLYCYNNQLTSLNVDASTNLEQLECYNNQLTTLNVGGSTNLQILICYDNQLTSLDISGLTNIQTLECYNNLLVSLDVSSAINLLYLNCNNNQLSLLPVDGLINLLELKCGNNQLSSLEVSNLINLQELYCFSNQLTSLNTSSLINLIGLVCGDNQLTSLNLNGLINLQELWCYNNQLSALNLDGFSNLYYLDCADNLLSSLDVGSLTSLFHLECSNNQIASLDLTELGVLEGLLCNDNPLLTSILLKNGRNESDLNFSNCLNLQYICADDNQITQVQDLISLYGYTTCNVNTYCSFTPGETFYTIQGNNKLDIDNNGCDGSDITAPNLNFIITDGTITENVILNVSGAYTIPVTAGTHTITPILENPSYYNISPSSIVVDFPAQGSPVIQNFCISISDPKPDLEIVFLPLQPARPGFSSAYKIIYKNKGNTAQSGTVNLTYNDDILIYAYGFPFITGLSTNNLSWNFTNLLPLETREITLTLQLNSPTDTPTVNGGDVLNYNAFITSAAIDETPNDNTFIFNQTVVNSFDPNDKTCLEGTTITPAKVGDYVHYMIRFENNGTANAQNIVVKDMIDLAKFDISTLVPMKGSHSFVTNVTSGNKVEFIFENINLPFDDANNDGYVAFKIKTKPTLVLGNTFSNTASIYFDYNFPIVTNTATTTIAVLATQDFVFSNYFTLYPNPVKDILNITAKETIEVTSINIYNTLGQLVLVIPNAQNTSSVDVSGLTKGNYFIKINSDKGTSNTKFIKN